jgi:hypothetical protein
MLWSDPQPSLADVDGGVATAERRSRGDDGGGARRARGARDGAAARRDAAAARREVAAARRVNGDKRGVKIAWVGRTVPGASRDGLLDGVRDGVRSADLTVGDLAAPLGEGGVPAEHAATLADAGFDVMHLARLRARERRRTARALTDRGLDYTGTPGRMAYHQRAGVRIAVLGFAPPAQGVPDVAAAAQLVRAADARAEIVVVVVDAGDGRRLAAALGSDAAAPGARGDARALAHAVVDAGADLVLGSGSTAVGGLELYAGRLIAYSTGDFAAPAAPGDFAAAGGTGDFAAPAAPGDFPAPAATGDFAAPAAPGDFPAPAATGASRPAAILRVVLDERGRPLRGRWDSLLVSRRGRPARDPAGASARLAARLSRQEHGAGAVPPRRDGGLPLDR